MSSRASYESNTSLTRAHRRPNVDSLGNSNLKIIFKNLIFSRISSRLITSHGQDISSSTKLSVRSAVICSTLTEDISLIHSIIDNLNRGRD